VFQGRSELQFSSKARRLPKANRGVGSNERGGVGDREAIHQHLTGADHSVRIGELGMLLRHPVTQFLESIRHPFNYRGVLRAARIPDRVKCLTGKGLASLRSPPRVN